MGCYIIITNLSGVLIYCIFFWEQGREIIHLHTREAYVCRTGIDTKQCIPHAMSCVQLVVIINYSIIIAYSHHTRAL